MVETYLRTVDDDDTEKYRPMQLRYREGTAYLDELRKRAPNGTSLVVKGDDIFVSTPQHYGIPEYRVDFSEQNHFRWKVSDDKRITLEILIPDLQVKREVSESNEDYEKVRVTNDEFRGLTEVIANFFWNDYYKIHKNVIREEKK